MPEPPQRPIVLTIFICHARAHWIVPKSTAARRDHTLAGLTAVRMLPLKPTGKKRASFARRPGGAVVGIGTLGHSEPAAGAPFMIIRLFAPIAKGTDKPKAC